MTQLSLDEEARRGEPNPNAWMFNEDGTPKRLLWCGDEARLGGPCRYVGSRARFMPAGGCCKDIVKEREGGSDD